MSELEALNQQIITCQKCILARSRTHAVPGEGPPNAEIMFIGEAPGFHEDQQGRPFVGAAGRFLEELLASVGLKREEVFIANVVKCFISPHVLIYTVDGYKPIKDIRVGDLVLTHSGYFRKVTYVRPREVLPASSEVVRLIISPPNGGRPIRLTVTPEHPFLVNGEWKPAKGIQAGDRVLTLGDRCDGQAQGPPLPQVIEKIRRVYRTCGPACHNKRIMHRPETRQKIRQIMARQYAEGLRDPVAMTARANERPRELLAAREAKIQRLTTEERYRERIVLAEHITAGQDKHPIGYGEYVFVEAVITQVEHRRTTRNFPLYNIGVEADESYIAAGVVSHNCRPPGNRDPFSDEIEACRPYLERQIELIKPRMVVTLGRFSMEMFFPGQKISQIHGRPKKVGGVIYYPMFHPAAALHQPRFRAMIEEDMRKIPHILAQMEGINDAGPQESAEQLSLF